MKKLIVLLLALILATFPSGVGAQASASEEATPTTKITQAAQKNEIENLKDKIASTVAELAKKTKKAVAGEITSVDKSTFTLTTDEGSKYTVKINKDLTKFYIITGGSKKEASLADFKKGTYVIVSGPIADSDVTANVVYQDQEYIVESGKIVEADKAAFVVRVLTQNKQEYMLDIESSTVQEIIDSKTLETEKIGFSKIKEGDEIHFVVNKGDATGTNKNRYSAKRIFILPQEYFEK